MTRLGNGPKTGGVNSFAWEKRKRRGNKGRDGTGTCGHPLPWRWDTNVTTWATKAPQGLGEEKARVRAKGNALAPN